MIRNVNCEAAIVFGQQIRLRNLSGLIIIDFVSMRITSHQEVVLETLRRAVADDPQQPFGGGRASGTNDKAGSPLNLLRWVSPRTIKENLCPPTDWRYPFLG